MTQQELPKLRETMLDTRVSGYDRSRAFAKFMGDDRHVHYLDDVKILLKDENPSFRCELVRTMRRRPLPQYEELFGFALSDSDDYVVREALRALTQCHNPRIVTSIETLVKTASMSTRYDAERTLAQIRDATLKETSPRTLDSTDTAEEPSESETEGHDISQETTPENTETREGVVAAAVGLTAFGLLMLFLA